jgi:hypothetical protein
VTEFPEPGPSLTGKGALLAVDDDVPDADVDPVAVDDDDEGSSKSTPSVLYSGGGGVTVFRMGSNSMRHITMITSSSTTKRNPTPTMKPRT